jgi:hypothetical protein
MRHQDLTDNIKGSILKKDFLEAFLMQSAYLEGILKFIADYEFFISIKPQDDSKQKFFDEIAKNFNKKSFSEITNFLQRMGTFDAETCKKLNSYREKRNKILHNLVTEILNSQFDQDLKETCQLGNDILENENFSRMIEAIERLDAKIRNKIGL